MKYSKREKNSYRAYLRMYEERAQKFISRGLAVPDRYDINEYFATVRDEKRYREKHGIKDKGNYAREIAKGQFQTYNWSTLQNYQSKRIKSIMAERHVNRNKAIEIYNQQEAFGYVSREDMLYRSEDVQSRVSSYANALKKMGYSSEDIRDMISLQFFDFDTPK